MKWTMVRSGLWTGTDGVHAAEAHRVREGSLRFAGWMWVTTLNGKYITNADTLNDAKQAVTEEIKGDSK